MADLRASVVISAIDRVTAPLRHISGGVNRTQAALNKLKRQQGSISAITALQKKLGSTASRMDLVRKRAALLGRQLAATANPTKKLQKEFEKSRRLSDQLKQKHREQRTALGRLRGELRASGVATGSLTAAQRRLEEQSGKLTRRLERQRRVQQAWGKAKSAMRKGSRAAGYGLGAIGIGVELFRRTFLSTAVQFEDFETILTTPVPRRRGDEPRKRRQQTPARGCSPQARG